MSTEMVAERTDVDPAIEDAARDAAVILTLTDAGREPAYRQSRSVAMTLARRTGATLLLVDRSQETWADTPHHQGPFTPKDLRGMGKVHLDDQLEEAAAEGVDVRVWVSSLPLPEGYYEETANHIRVGLSVLPERLEHPKIAERLAGTRTAAAAKALVPGIPVVQVWGDGTLQLL